MHTMACHTCDKGLFWGMQIEIYHISDRKISFATIEIFFIRNSFNRKINFFLRINIFIELNGP